MGLGAKIKGMVRNDPNFPRLGKGIVLGTRGLRAGAGGYFTDKVPIVQWIAAYSPKWLMDDALAGSSVGMLLLPQALIYSTLAGVPIQQALLASWLPGIIYSVMGTSRDISVGPTASSAVFTATIVKELGEFKIPPSIALTVVTFSMSIWAMIFGVLNLGFILDFVSVPMALGFTLGTAIVVINTQIPAILGLEGISNVFTEMMPQIIHEIGKSKPITFGIAAVSILLLGLLQFIGNKWGHKNVFIRTFTASRHINVIAMFTGFSYFINKDLETPQWAVLGPITTTLPAAQGPNSAVLPGLFVSMIILMLSTALEHVTLAKSFAHSHGYTINASQEIFSLGVVNLVNSFFGGMPVGGGDMARASVNATAGVKSPLSGLFTSATVFIGMYFLSGSLQYIPQATIAAVIVVAVFDQMPPQALMGKYWKISFVDFVVFFLAFNMTLAASGALGIGMAFFFVVGYTLMRLMFSRPTALVSIDLETQYSNNTPPWWGKEDRIAAGTQVIKLETDAIWLNTERLKRHIIDTAYTYQSGSPSINSTGKERAWNYRLDKHIAKLRSSKGINDTDTFFPRLRIVILDFTSTSFVDVCACQVLEEVKTDLRTYAGEGVEFRFVGMNKEVKRRFERAGWKIVSPLDEPDIGVAVGGEGEAAQEDDLVKDLCFEHLSHAIQHITPTRPEDYDFEKVNVVDMQKF